MDTWLWHFGDEMTSTLQNPSHIYDGAGVYTVSLAVAGPGGSDLLVKPSYIIVYGERWVYLPLVVRGAASRRS